MTLPLCSVITPTWGRHELLLERCIPSVAAQEYLAVEQVVVSDGPDPELDEVLGYARLRKSRKRQLYFAGEHPGLPMVYDSLAAHDPMPHWGHHARLRGTELAAGDLITYLDDDDCYRPAHVQLLAEALKLRPEAGFAYSLMVAHNPSGDVLIGTGAFSAGNVGTPMVMHRRELLEIASWNGAASAFEDWELFAAWVNAGVQYIHVPAETVDVYYSQFRENQPWPP